MLPPHDVHNSGWRIKEVKGTTVVRGLSRFIHIGLPLSF